MAALAVPLSISTGFLDDWALIEGGITRVCNTTQPLFGYAAVTPDLVLSTLDGPLGSQVRPWQSQFSSIAAVTDTLGDRSPLYLYLEVSLASTVTTRNVRVHLCNALVPLDPGQSVSEESQMYRRCGNPDAIDFPTSCDVNITDVTGAALSCLCTGRAEPDVATVETCRTHCTLEYTTACETVNFTVESGFPLFTRPASLTTTTATVDGEPATAMGVCYGLDSQNPQEFCDQAATNWCQQGDFFRVANYELINIYIENDRFLKNLTWLDSSVTGDLSNQLDGLYSTMADHLHTSCVCAGRRNDGWFRNMLSIIHDHDIDANALWYNPDLTVRDFWPADETNLEFLQMYSVRGPLVAANGSAALLHPNATGALKPSDETCRAQSCTVVEPVLLPYNRVSSKRLCEWSCVLFETIDITEAPLVSVRPQGSAISQCPARYTLVNMAIVSRPPARAHRCRRELTRRMLQLPSIFASVFYFDLMPFMVFHNASEKAISPLLWSPWINMTTSWLSAYDLDPGQCSSDVVGTCTPVLQYYESGLRWHESLTYLASNFITTTGVLESMQGPHLFPDISVERPIGCDVLTADVITPIQVLHLRHTLLTLYQRAIMNSGRNCDSVYRTSIPFYVMECGVGFGGEANITIRMVQTKAIDTSRSCLDFTCVSSMHAHDTECTKITNKTMCDLVPLCHSCPKSLSGAPTQPLANFTFPPTIAHRVIGTTIEHDFMAIVGIFILIVVVLIAVPWVRTVLGTEDISSSQESVRFLDDEGV